MKLYQFNWDCGRSGELDGLFVATPEVLEPLFGKEIYFGEVLGKHSEIFDTLERDEITTKSDDSEFVTKMVEVLGLDTSSGWATVSGFNPLDYYEPEEEVK